MGLHLGANSDIKHSDLSSAVSTVILSAGSPTIRESTAGRNIVYSGRHDGLALLLARWLRPIWNVKVTIPAMGGRQVLAVPERMLQNVQAYC